MKKRATALLMAALIGTFCMIGCGNEEVSSPDAETGVSVPGSEVSVSGSEKVEAANDPELEDGNYAVELTFEGGSGKAEILTPAAMTVSGGTATAVLQWNSPNYDYMIVDGEKYLPVNAEGNSVFEIPVRIFDEPINVIGDTVAMSTPHEVEYTLTFHSDTVKPAE